MIRYIMLEDKSLFIKYLAGLSDLEKISSNANAAPTARLIAESAFDWLMAQYEIEDGWVNIVTEN